MINWARRVIRPGGSSRRSGGAGGAAVDFTGAVGKTAVSNLSSAVPGSAIFLRHSLAEVVVGRPLGDLGSAAPWQSAGGTSKLTSWGPLRKTCMVGRERFPYAGPVQKKREPTR